MNVKITVTGRDELKQRLNLLVKNTQALLTQQVRKSTLGCRKEAKDLCPKASGDLRQSIQSRFLDLGKMGEVFVGLKYGQWVEGIWHNGKMGRDKGKWPPPLPILKWVIIKQLHTKSYGKKGTTLSNAERIAYLIRRKIGLKGTRAKPFLKPAFLHYKIAFEQGCRKILRRAAELAHIEMRRAAS